MPLAYQSESACHVGFPTKNMGLQRYADTPDHFACWITARKGRTSSNTAEPRSKASAFSVRVMNSALPRKTIPNSPVTRYSSWARSNLAIELIDLWMLHPPVCTVVISAGPDYSRRAQLACTLFF